ncbi:type III polyketide synthase [Coraliomargarita sp. W4R53]
MYLQSISHAVPPQSFTQAECWDILKDSPALDALKPRSQTLLEKVLKGDSGIRKRHFATDRVEDLFTLDAESLNRKFEIEAPKLAAAALSKALTKAGLLASDLDALFICTCTGYLCPGLTSYVAERMGMSNRAYLQDIVGLGCGAAIPTLRSAQGFLAANPNATVACIAVEICSAAFYLDNDPGVLISASLFGDAASASIWSGTNKSNQYCIQKFDTLHQPEQRELLRFTNCAGKLRNKLDRSVPGIAASAVKQLYQQADIKEPHRIAAHVGGRDVLDALESTLGIPPLKPSWDALANYGNTSSPSVLIATEAIIKNESNADRIWLTSFGAGFAAHSCELTLAMP